MAGDSNVTDDDDVHDGQVLRLLRLRRGLSLRELERVSKVSFSHLGNIEQGRKPLTFDVARACDRALRTNTLVALVGTQGDSMQRRALLAHLGLTTTAGLAVGPAVLAEELRLALRQGTSATPIDWGATVDAYSRRLVANPSLEFGGEVFADLAAVMQQVRAGQPSLDLLRTGAQLSQIYGLWLGNQADLVHARRWYDLAALLADRSTDMATRTWTRGRATARGAYEGLTVQETVTGAQEVLALTSTPTTGAVEAYAALAHVHALTGDANAGQRAIDGMRSVVDRLPDTELRTLADPVQRVYSLDAFLKCRVGPLDVAERACEAAFRVLKAWPMWSAETQVYLGRARVAAGDLTGIGYALAAVTEVRDPVRVIGVAVRDVFSVVPPGHRSEELHALAQYASPGRMPWEAI